VVSVMDRVSSRPPPLVFDPLDENHLVDPYPRYRTLRDTDPVSFLEPLGIWLVSRYNDVETVLRDAETYSSKLGLGSGWTLTDSRLVPPIEMNFQASIPEVAVLLGADGLEHDRLRRLVSGLFTPRNVRSIETDLRAIIDSIIGPILSGVESESEVVSEVARPIAAQAICALLGLPPSMISAVISLVSELTESWDPSLRRKGDHELTRWRKHSWDFYREILRLVRYRSQHPGQGVLDVLIEQHAKEPPLLSYQEVAAFVSLLVMTGYETTCSAISNVMRLLLDEASLLSDLRLRQERIPIAIEEGLRYESPVQATWRGATRDSNLSGVSIPEGSRIMVLIGSANRDERRYSHPDRFVVDRAPSHLGFGIGVHSCIGAFLARRELCYLVSRVVEFPGTISRSGPVVPTTNVNLRGLRRLPVQVRA
jgi:cytochrome P450